MKFILTRRRGAPPLPTPIPPASMIQWVEEANKLREDLPPEVQSTLLRHEVGGTTDSKEYEEAMTVFYHRHVCRTVPYPEFVQRSFDKLAKNPEVYFTMNGPSEFHVIGTLKNWDVRHRLPEIKVPTLVTSGQHDEATPIIAE